MKNIIDTLSTVVTGAGVIVMLSAPTITVTRAVTNTFNPTYEGKLNNLFINSESIGPIAIGMAEGNLVIKDGQIIKTSRYDLHYDPANGKPNSGWCSDQGRAGGNVKKADKLCLERTKDRIPRLVNKFKAADLNPEKDTEAFINALDLWNQASPWVSDNYAESYKKALSLKLKGLDAIRWARVESFRKNGELSAEGLFRICANPNNTAYKGLNIYVVRSEKWRFGCIAIDQYRRAEAINKALTWFVNNSKS
jgi:hypothetical protein